MNAFDTHRAAEGLYACGHSLFSQERYADAATVFRALAAAVPSDERGWLGLGACHEAIDQGWMAIELYRTGEELARSARCAIARARANVAKGDEADEALDTAETLACGDDELEEMVRKERAR